MELIRTEQRNRSGSDCKLIERQLRSWRRAVLSDAVQQVAHYSTIQCTQQKLFTVHSDGHSGPAVVPIYEAIKRNLQEQQRQKDNLVY